MLEIFLIIAILLGAAKRRGRSMRNYLRGRVNETLALSTLAGTTLISDIFDDLPTERTFVASIVAVWSMINFTPAASDGPILVGLAHSDYSDAEIEAVIENTGSWDSGDKVQSREIAKRLVRSVGVFGGMGVSADEVAMTLNDGKPIKTKLNWTLAGGQGLRLWAYNLGSSALATTSPIVHLDGHANIWTL